jgi:hypothetical protein
MIISNSMREDLAQMIQDLPVVFVYSGGSYAGTRSETNDNDDMEPGGFNPQDAFNLVVPLEVKTAGTWTSTFTGSQPDLGSALVINGGFWRVQTAQRSQDGLALMLGLRR